MEIIHHDTVLTAGKLSRLIDHAILTVLMMLSVVLILMTTARSCGCKITEGLMK